MSGFHGSGGGGLHGAGGGGNIHGAGGGHGHGAGGGLGGVHHDSMHAVIAQGAGYGYYGFGGYGGFGYGGFGYGGYYGYYGYAGPAVFTAQTVAQALADFSAYPYDAQISVLDSAANVAAGLDSLKSIASAHELTGISLTDSGTPILSIHGEQLASDAAAISLIGGNFTISATAPATSATLAGAENALANVLVFDGNAGQYSITPSGDGVNFTVSGNGVTDQLSNFQELQFADHTLIVAAAPGQGTVTSGNIAELYSAVFAREPDAAGLGYYETYLKNNPATPAVQFADWFLASSEYTSNPAHNYAQSSAGDVQFISDSYQNLLHRAPSASELAFYQANVATPAEAGLTPGTQAFANAQFLAHAQILVYLSTSQEFLSDVKVTATQPADAGHWLVLI